jgi:hypothetical protein
MIKTFLFLLITLIAELCFANTPQRTISPTTACVGSLFASQTNASLPYKWLDSDNLSSIVSSKGLGNDQMVKIINSQGTSVIKGGICQPFDKNNTLEVEISNWIREVAVRGNSKGQFDKDAFNVFRICTLVKNDKIKAAIPKNYSLAPPEAASDEKPSHKAFDVQTIQHSAP